MTLKKIISGGQTGADQGGLEAGKELGLETGGQAPLGWKTERGPQEKLLQSFGLIQHWSSNYDKRTEANVLNSNGTVIFGNHSSAGSKLTARLCLKHHKPCLLISTDALNEMLQPKNLVETFRAELNSRLISEERAERWGTSNSLPDFIRHHNLIVLNVAGNRESYNPGIQERVKNFLVQALKGDK